MDKLYTAHVSHILNARQSTKVGLELSVLLAQPPLHEEVVWSRLAANITMVNFIIILE